MAAVLRVMGLSDGRAAALPAHTPERSAALDRAGHLMYASHVSYRDSAKLGAPECDLLVDLVRKHELDILDIPIAFITEKYLEYLDMLRDVFAECVRCMAKVAVSLEATVIERLAPIAQGAKP